MFRATCVVAIAMLAGCADGAAPGEPQQLASCPLLDDGCPPDHLGCTWCRSIAATCDPTTPALFCARGFGWCTEEGMCREICREEPRCPAGTVVTHEPDERAIGGTVCVCAPG